MPQVGKKKFAYTPEGIAKARKEQNMTGRPMNMNIKYRGGVRPIDPNKSAVNNFMNRSAMSDHLNQNTMSPDSDRVKKFQSGLNFLNKGNPGYKPLKVDGVMGPKTKATADRYLK